MSFRAALDYLRGLPHLAIRHVDLPVRHDRSGNPPGGVDHPRTILGIIRAVVGMSRADTVVVFGSSRFCFSYGVLLLTIAALLRKRSAVRIFGGRPALAVAPLPAVVPNRALQVAGTGRRGSRPDRHRPGGAPGSVTHQVHGRSRLSSLPGSVAAGPSCRQTDRLCLRRHVRREGRRGPPRRVRPGASRLPGTRRASPVRDRPRRRQRTSRTDTRRRDARQGGQRAAATRPSAA